MTPDNAEQLPYLQSHEGRTTDEVIALEGKYRTDSLVAAIEGALLGKDAWSPEERYVVAIEALEREVNNGGYWQLFINSSRDHAQVMEEALRAIGCPKTADITRDAIAAIAPDGDLDPDRLAAAAENPSDDVQAALAACDDRFFATDEAIADELFDWIKINRARISLA